MVCAKCGHWAYQYDWIRHRLGENNLLLRDGYADPETPSLYWFMVCKPNCELNAVRHASFRLEEAAAATIEELKVVEELRRAWVKYYAYW